jgi:uncharacterized repeat protein (TIGR03803 family)
MRGFSTSIKVSFVLAIALWLANPNAARSQTLPAFFTLLHAFTNSSEAEQPVSLFLGPGNALYGVTYSGSGSNYSGGTIFKMNPDGSDYTILQGFSKSETGNSNAAAAQSIVSVGGSALYGQVPLTGGLTLTPGRDGYLYGTTFYGGTNSPGETNFGTVFKLNSQVSSITNAILDPFTVLHSFTAADEHPVNLVQGTDGLLYGTTWNGSVFRLTTNGSSYLSTPQPVGYCPSLIQGSDGMLYGTAMFGPSDSSQSQVFKINTNNLISTILTNLSSASLFSSSSILQGSDEYLYLTPCFGTVRGDISGLCRMNTNGSGLTLLHEFTGKPDGQIPIGLVEGQDGLLYGTTLEGGTNNEGTIYAIGPNGANSSNGSNIMKEAVNYSVVYNFGPTNAYPMGMFAANLLPGIEEVVYGTTTLSYGTNGIFGTTSVAYGAAFSLAVHPALSFIPADQAIYGQMQVVWPAWAGGYSLQSTTNLSSPQWVNLNQNPDVATYENGIPCTGLQLTNNAPATYYRLMHQ